MVTLSGTLEFTTRDGETFALAPGDVLRAADTAGSGHRWRLIDDQPWRRLYVELDVPGGSAADDHAAMTPARAAQPTFARRARLPAIEIV